MNTEQLLNTVELSLKLLPLAPDTTVKIQFGGVSFTLWYYQEQKTPFLEATLYYRQLARKTVKDMDADEIVEAIRTVVASNLPDTAEPMTGGFGETPFDDEVIHG